MQLRMSPGGRMRFSRRRRPELPPSSVTVTIAVRLAMGCSVLISSRRRETRFLRPRSRVERPVPPPRATTLKPLEERLDLGADLFTIRLRCDFASQFWTQQCRESNALNYEAPKAGSYRRRVQIQQSRRLFNARNMLRVPGGGCNVTLRRCGVYARRSQFAEPSFSG